MPSLQCPRPLLPGPPAYHCGHYLYLAPLCPGLWCPLKELHAHLPRGLSCLESNSLLPAPTTRTSGVCQPCSECPFPKDQTQLFWGCPMALQVPYLHGLPSSVHSKLCHARVFCWGTCMLIVRWSVTQRKGKVDWSGRVKCKGC